VDSGETGLEFEIGRFTRRCAATDRELRPGDAFYSVLVPDGGAVLRKDYSADHWPGAPDEAICWWKSEMPDVSAHKVTWAPNDAILECFAELTEKSDQADQLYVLALLLIRKRIVRLEETQQNAAGDEEMLLYCPGNEKEYRVRVVEPDAGRIEQIQQGLAQLLFSAVK
jgi:hypothetical protein